MIVKSTLIYTPNSLIIILICFNSASFLDGKQCRWKKFQGGVRNLTVPIIIVLNIESWTPDNLGKIIGLFGLYYGGEIRRQGKLHLELPRLLLICAHFSFHKFISDIFGLFVIPRILGFGQKFFFFFPVVVFEIFAKNSKLCTPMLVLNGYII